MINIDKKLRELYLNQAMKALMSVLNIKDPFKSRNILPLTYMNSSTKQEKCMPRH